MNEGGKTARTGAFAGFHPVVNILYFCLVMGFGMFFTHPVCLMISFAAAFAYSVFLTGKKALKFGLLFLLPMLIATALINPAFNHQGGTILTYLPSGNPLTLESIAYGIAAALMLAAVVSWFSCFTAVMTSDKIVYLLGRAIPAMSLILSMILRLVPRFAEQIKAISDAQKCVGRDAGHGNILQRIRHGARILSIVVTWALENAIETADSMKSRGYGLKGRSAFSIYRFSRRDWLALAFLAFCGVYIITGAAFGGLYFRYFPTIKGIYGNAYTISLLAAYLALCLFPLIMGIYEDRKWKLSALKA